ncbi:MAG: CpaD family pilus assembly lipoprotein [Pseudobdellovibrionaceae bacterium]
MTRKFLLPRTLLSALVVGVSLTACSFDMPSHMTQERMDIVQSPTQQKYVTGDLTQPMLQDIAAEARHRGASSMDVTVTYDPASKTNTKAKAEYEANRIADTLEKQGVRSVNVATLPVTDSWNVSNTLITYMQVDASMSDNCGKMPGYDDAYDAGDTEKHQAYEYGCTIHDVFAQQLADPSDLMGKDGFDTPEDGRRAENVVSGRGYYGNQRLKPLKGETTSD